MDNIEKRILEIIDGKREEIIAFGRDIFNHAEMGYKEFRTAGKFNDLLRSLGLEVEEGLAITGSKAYLKGKETAGPTVALIGELDALPVTNAKHTNPETGAAHCCGHNAQLTGVMGAALALCDPEIKAVFEKLDGNIAFLSAPAEEFVDIEFKNKLRAEGKIRYGGGKCELIRVGAMEGIDIAVGHHTHVDRGDVSVLNGSSNGFVNKTVRFIGKASHAAGKPEDGIDALNAATLALHAIDMQRESFRDQDAVRCHGFITRGGEAVNIIADNVTMEYCARANNIAAVKNANYKVDRSFRAAAMATGCGLEVVTMSGYLPTKPAKSVEALEAAIRDAYPAYESDPRSNEATTGSTDYGDISSIMPLLQFCTGGYSGALHHPSIAVTDEDVAYVLTAKVFALTAYKLLKNNAASAKALLESYTPDFNRESYIAYMDSMNSSEKVELTPVPTY